jgi:hypothetical protein
VLTKTQDLVADAEFKKLLNQRPDDQSPLLFLHKEVWRLIPELSGFWIMKAPECTCGCNESTKKT